MDRQQLCGMLRAYAQSQEGKDVCGVPVIGQGTEPEDKTCQIPNVQVELQYRLGQHPAMVGTNLE